MTLIGAPLSALALLLGPPLFDVPLLLQAAAVSTQATITEPDMIFLRRV